MIKIGQRYILKGTDITCVVIDVHDSYIQYEFIKGDLIITDTVTVKRFKSSWELI